MKKSSKRSNSSNSQKKSLKKKRTQSSKQDPSMRIFMETVQLTGFYKILFNMDITTIIYCMIENPKEFLKLFGKINNILVTKILPSLLTQLEDYKKTLSPRDADLLDKLSPILMKLYTESMYLPSSQLTLNLDPSSQAGIMMGGAAAARPEYKPILDKINKLHVAKKKLVEKLDKKKDKEEIEKINRKIRKINEQMKDLRRQLLPSENTESNENNTQSSSTENNNNSPSPSPSHSARRSAHTRLVPYNPAGPARRRRGIAVPTYKMDQYNNSSAGQGVPFVSKITEIARMYDNQQREIYMRRVKSWMGTKGLTKLRVFLRSFINNEEDVQDKWVKTIKNEMDEKLYNRNIEETITTLKKQLNRKTYRGMFGIGINGAMMVGGACMLLTTLTAQLQAEDNAYDVCMEEHLLTGWIPFMGCGGLTRTVRQGAFTVATVGICAVVGILSLKGVSQAVEGYSQADEAYEAIRQLETMYKRIVNNHISVFIDKGVALLNALATQDESKLVALLAVLGIDNPYPSTEFLKDENTTEKDEEITKVYTELLVALSGNLKVAIPLSKLTIESNNRERLAELQGAILQTGKQYTKQLHKISKTLSVGEAVDTAASAASACTSFLTTGATGAVRCAGAGVRTGVRVTTGL